jgi:hypothetical protein
MINLSALLLKAATSTPDTNTLNQKIIRKITELPQ